MNERADGTWVSAFRLPLRQHRIRQECEVGSLSSNNVGLCRKTMLEEILGFLMSAFALLEWRLS